MHSRDAKEVEDRRHRRHN